MLTLCHSPLSSLSIMHLLVEVTLLSTKPIHHAHPRSEVAYTTRASGHSRGPSDAVKAMFSPLLGIKSPPVTPAAARQHMPPQPYAKQLLQWQQERGFASPDGSLIDKDVLTALVDVERAMFAARPVMMTWDSDWLLMAVLDSGVIVRAGVSELTGGLISLLQDKSLTSLKGQQSVLSDCVIGSAMIACSFRDIPRIAIGHYDRSRAVSASDVHKLRSLSSLALEYNVFSLPVQVAKPSARLSLNTTEDRLLVWWRDASSKVWLCIHVAHSFDHPSDAKQLCNLQSGSGSCSRDIE